MPALELRVDQLLLDSQNPRIGAAGGQRDALQKLLDDQEDKLFALAESIVSDGMSPIDRLLVVHEKKGSKRYVILEGNRRLAALKILANPNVLSGLEVKSALRRRFEALAQDYDPKSVEPMSCFEVPSREEGMLWLYLRHTGENEGRGVVSWSGLAASRFRGRDPALQALELVRAHGDLSDDEKQLITGNKFPISTLDRLLAAREVRKRIGVDVKNRKLCSGLAAEELIKSLRRIVLDLAQKKINVSQLKNKDQQVEYIESFDAASKPDLTKKKAVRPIEDIQASEFPQKPRKKPRKPDPSERRTIVPRTTRLNIEDSKSAAIFGELKKIKVDEFPNAAAVLLRVFLELSTDHYMEAYSLPLKYKDRKSGRMIEKSLKKKLIEVIDHLVKHKGCNNKDFIGIKRALSVEHSPYYIELLHAYLHNRFVTPKTRDLTGAWDDAHRFFESVWA